MVIYSSIEVIFKSLKVLAIGKSKNSEPHHSHQVSITVNAELWPNDPVIGQNINENIYFFKQLLHYRLKMFVNRAKVYVKHYFGDIVCESKGEGGFSLFSGALIHKPSIHKSLQIVYMYSQNWSHSCKRESKREITWRRH